MSRAVDYRHVQPFTVLWVLLPLTALAVTALALKQRDPAVFGVLALNWGLCLVVLALLGRLAIEVRGDVLHWGFGYVGWPRWQLRLEEIAQMDVGRPSAWLGAGIKGLGSHRLYNVSMGGPALQLTLRDGRRITLGTPEPDRLDAVLRARLGAR